MKLDRPETRAGAIPEEYEDRFEGSARFQMLESPFEGGPAAYYVHFDAGGRTHPHVHRSGQILQIVSGRGIVADEDERHIVGVGDTVVVEPDEWHWHGGLRDTAMSHLTVQYTGADLDWDVPARDWAEGYGAD